MIHTTTNKGLHNLVGEQVLTNYARPGLKAADLGSGPGAMAVRLHQMGCDLIAADQSANGFVPQLLHQTVNFNQADFAAKLSEGAFGILTVIEVVEHVERPIGFSRNAGRMLSPGCVEILTTRNVDSFPARLKFFLAGKIRPMDEHSEPTHIPPIFCDLLQRQFLPHADLRLRQHLLFLPDGFQLSHKTVAWFMRLAARVFSGESILRDNHIFMLEAVS
jgi:2-polyprenyl-3-methyl-5-hydroxy-6-metoxy-1,4-benzoquinol methylase